jgi:hypothetical protein
MKIARQLWALILAAVFAASCSSGQDLATVEAEVARFRQSMAAQQFGQIYSEASDQLKKTMTEQELVRVLAAIDRKLGPVKDAKKNGWTVNYNTSGTSVTLKFKTEFDRGAEEETFVYRITGGKAQLVGYNINSTALITN